MHVVFIESCSSCLFCSVPFGKRFETTANTKIARSIVRQIPAPVKKGKES